MTPYRERREAGEYEPAGYMQGQQPDQDAARPKPKPQPTPKPTPDKPTPDTGDDEG